ncbi:PrgU family protein [Carnobacterium maltaromaticum]|uniref:PrgU family protein n=1 Tax=Carnobacterium maltaromaticum TaxID=2751 RepID=UPI0007052318|nr:PrgU family protein [Carnobacterium maltaromaticum]AOA04041.1 hypothetical protein BFC23_16975 [Carnobacterium maltaromaticum]MBC9810556.1 hypothetical protein [Carnobacterium maltaromaticum]
MSELYLNARDVTLEYRSNTLRKIHLKTNKVIEMVGNKLLTEENTRNITTICLVKGKETVKIDIQSIRLDFRLKANDGKLAKFVVTSTWTRLDIQQGLQNKK